MKMHKKFLITLFGLVLMAFGNKNHLAAGNMNINCEIYQDTTFKYQDKLQGEVDNLIKTKRFNFEDEKNIVEDVLFTKEKALTFAKNLIVLKMPYFKGYEKLKYEIGEDKTGKLWFITATYPEPTFGGNIHIIVVKNNCKVLYYLKTV